MADRRSTITLDVVGNFDEQMKKFSAGMQGMVASTNATAQGVSAMAGAQSQAAAAATQHEAAMGREANASINLADKTGLNRREMSLMFGEIQNVTGASPALIQGLEGLAHGFGATALAVVGGVEVLKMAQQAIKDHIAALSAQAAQLATTDISLGDYVQRTKELRVETALMTEAQDLLTKGIWASATSFAYAIDNADRLAAAELKVGQFMGAMGKAQVEQDAATANSAKTALQYDQSIMKLADDFAPLNFAGKQFNQLEADQKAAMLDLARAYAQHTALATDAANQTVTFTDDGMANAKAVQDQTDALRLADIALNKVAQTTDITAGAFNSVAFQIFGATSALDGFTSSSKRFEENQNMMGGMGGGDAAMKKFLGDTSYQNNLKAGQDALAAQTKAAQQAQQIAQQQKAIFDKMAADSLRIFDTMSAGGVNAATNVNKAFTDSFVSIIDQQDKLNGAAGTSLIQLQKEYATTFAAMSANSKQELLAILATGGPVAEGLIKQLAAIAEAGGSVEAQLQAIRAAFGNLNGMVATMGIDLTVYASMAGGGGGPGGNQQGNQWNFTLSGESNAVKQAYINQYGQTQAANDAWARDHQQELRDKGVPPPTNTPAAAALSPSKNNGMNVNVTLQSFMPANEFDLQQIGRRIKEILRTN